MRKQSQIGDALVALIKSSRAFMGNGRAVTSKELEKLEMALEIS
jgi:hypothetical protein